MYYILEWMLVGSSIPYDVGTCIMYMAANISILQCLFVRLLHLTIFSD